MNLVKPNLFEFTRNSDPLDTLGIGYTGKIHKFFDNLNVSRDRYTIENKQIILVHYLDLDDCTSLVELPDNLTIGSYLSLIGCINLIKLPNNLKVSKTLYLNNCTNLTKLPDDLTVYGKIYIREEQKQLRNWIENSKFANQLRIK